ncbi:MAG: U32 family peptidase [Desulfobacteraceae bacterium]|nr:U32 family peptidase [Desulfobacteraceae bacterium]
MNPTIPMILAPAGNTKSFLAAIAAGADAIYCGLKIFSARMEADNFSIEELSRLSALAHSKQIKVYIAFNSIIKETELEKVFNILTKLCQFVQFDALIIQDLAMIPLAKKAGFKKQFHLSTLGNCTSPSGLEAAEKAGFSRVVLPREFNIDEIKEMAQKKPDQMTLEIFIHGALCYSISGRCYWSSWFGGKSALRGRCVQPCRRIYEQKDQKKRHFSCMDFSADVLTKVLKEIAGVSTWKIEGRKKSPHYVYYTVKAYRLLRDDPTKKKEAMAYLDYAMGRQFSHYNLLSQRIQNPLDHTSETGSGLFLGRIKNPAEPYFNTQEELFNGDLLRIGYEENEFHDIQKVTRAIPKKGKFYLSKRSKFKIKKGTPVFIIDRRGPELQTLIKGLEAELDRMEKEKAEKIRVEPVTNIPFLSTRTAKQSSSKKRSVELYVSRGNHNANKNHSIKRHEDKGLWIASNAYGNKPQGRTWLWLDPLVFPGEENICRNYVDKAIKKGAKNFVLNAFWQIGLFKDPKNLNLWGGPFCNITNSMTINLMKTHGFSGAIVSPELDKETILRLPETSDLPLGIVTHGNWPLAVSRIISPDLTLGQIFQSPKGEGAWISKSNNIYYVFPNWPLDLSAQKEELERAGYSVFVSLLENIPKTIKMKQRPGLWNWNLKLL